MVPEAAPKLELWVPGIPAVPVAGLPEERSQQAEFERLSLFEEHLLEAHHPSGPGAQRCRRRTLLPGR